MARRKISDFLPDLKKAFREHGDNFQAVSRTAKVSRNTAKKAWFEGYPDKDIPPLKDFIADERKAARAAMSTVMNEITVDHETQLEIKARKIAIEARADEGLMIRRTRKSIMKLMETAENLSDSILEIAPQIRTAIMGMELNTVDDLERMVRLYRSLSMITQNGARSAYQTIQAERLLLGQPTDIVGAQSVGDATIEDAWEEINRARSDIERALERKRKRDERKRRLAIDSN